MKHKVLNIRWVLALVLVLLLALAGTAAAQEPESSDPPPPDPESPPQLEATPIASVVIIGGYTLDWGPCRGYGSEANNMGRTYGGCLPVSEFTGLSDFSFTPMDHTAVSAASLAPFDIAVLNIASSRMACNTGKLTSQQKADLLAFVASGKKLIIFDSECWPQDYSWVPFPFTTANPGAMGAPGSLTIVEENTLSSNDSANPYYINAYHLGRYTDAVGDMNVMTTYDPNWCVDMSGTNYLNVTGPVHTYAKYPAGTDVGLIIYNGLDQDYQGYGINDLWLRKMWIQELKQPVNPSNLPCGVTVVGISLSPATAENEVGESHSVTATLSDLLGNPQPGIAVTFSVISGPNSGASGTCSANADCTTDANGQVSFTYTGDGGVGTDSIEACFTDQGGNNICSQTVTKDWIITNQPPVADANGDYSGAEGSAIPLDGTGSYDPDVDPLSFSWSVDSALCSFDDATSPTPNLTCTDNGDFTVTLVVDDGQATDSDTAAVTVNNVAPTVGPISVDSTLVSVGTPINAGANFTDPGTADTHTATCDWGDGTIHTEDPATTPVFDSHRYTAAGVYTVQMTVTDDDVGTGQSVFQYVVVYDASAGFVTGGGWIESPAGAYKPDTSLAGKANFGFVSKYKKGATTPTGNTEFQFHAASLNFHSDSYEWLVVTGSDYAMFKGEGTINGEGGQYGLYCFRIWAGDEPDTFRIRIWEEDEATAIETDVYDNGFDQAIGGGSIVIHTGKK